MKNKKIVYLKPDEEKMDYVLTVINVVDEKLDMILNAKNKRLIKIDNLRLQVMMYNEFTDHIRYHLYDYDAKKSEIEGFLSSAFTSPSIMQHMVGLNERELIDFHDEIFHECITEYEVRKTHEMYEEYENDRMFPLKYNGKLYHKKDCDDMFLAYYCGPEALNAENGVYVADGVWVTPDGNLSEW